MKRIIISLSIIGAAAAIAIGATSSYFSDTETSSGNTFTAGAIDLQIDNTCTYDGVACPEPTGVQTSWGLTDLQNGVHKFFDFADIKPGDFGEDTISMHITNNDAWACLDISSLRGLDNTCTEPEREAEGTVCATNGNLAQDLNFTAWGDLNCNNVWDGNEQLLFFNKKGPASDVLNGKTYALADASTGTGPIVANGQNFCLGVKWCAGSMQIDEATKTIACDGAAMGNQSQTDSLAADISFRVVQSKNNPDFRCVAVNNNIETLTLENKDENYNRLTNDGIYGTLQFDKSSSTFNFTLNAYKLTPSINYSLIYYADPWPGNGTIGTTGALIWSGDTNASGNIIGISGNTEINTDIPNTVDANYSTGGKIWLIPSSAYNSSSRSVTVWPFTDKWLFETNLIKYTNS